MSWKDSFMQEIEEISTKKDLKPFQSFLFWYLKSTEGLSDEKIKEIIMDRSRDAGCDAVYIDYNLKIVKVFQSKFTSHFGEIPFNKDEILKLERIYEYLRGDLNFDNLRRYVHTNLKDKLDSAIRLITEEGFKLKLIFITNHKDNYYHNIYSENGDIPLEVVASNGLKRKYEEWIHGHTPELGEMRINYQDILKVPSEPKSFIINIKTDEIRNIYRRFKEKLFSRNVRVFYENTKPNKAIKDTLIKEPKFFWYFNNGITILSESIEENKKDNELILNNPQIINGCQTVTQIGENTTSNALLCAKIIEVTDSLINQKFIDGIIEANNRQNPVDERILKSNHPLQVKLQRSLEHLGYYYERKEREYNQQIKKSPKVQDLKKINNKELVQTNLAIAKEPRFPVKDNEDDLFSIRFNDVFEENKNALEYLIPYLIWKKVVSMGTKYKRNYNRSRFHKLSAFHALRLIYDFCPNLKNRVKLNDIFKLLESKRFNLNEKPVKEIFDIAFKKFSKSKYREFDSGQRDFFKQRDAYESIKNSIMKSTQNQIYKLFNN